MKVLLKYMGQLKQAADKDSEIIECSQDVGLIDVLVCADKQNDNETFNKILFDDKGNIRLSVMIMLNGKPISKTEEVAIADGDSITILSAIAGG